MLGILSLKATYGAVTVFTFSQFERLPSVILETLFSIRTPSIFAQSEALRSSCELESILLRITRVDPSIEYADPPLPMTSASEESVGEQQIARTSATRTADRTSLKRRSPCIVSPIREVPSRLPSGRDPLHITRKDIRGMWGSRRCWGNPRRSDRCTSCRRW